MPLATSVTKKRALPVKGVNSSYRKRDLVFATGKTRESFGNTTWKAQFGKTWDGKQVTASENHPSWRKAKSFRGDVGGNFLSTRTYCKTKVLTKGLRGELLIPGTELQQVVYTGYVLPGLPPAGDVYPPSAASPDWALDAFGTEAIANCKPTNSVADASVFLGELLREGLPKLSTDILERLRGKTEKARKLAASEYLAVEFGWKPIASDLAKFIHAVEHADSVLAQYERDSGRMVRRRYEFPPEKETTTTLHADGVRPSIAFVIDALNEPGVVPTGKVYRTRETVRRRWFSGAFTYYLAGGGNARSQMARQAQMSKKLLGLSLTPDLVWNLSPWSWAIDWVTNAGDVVSNLTDLATDGLVLRYGYIMEHSSVTDTYTFSGPTGFQSKSVRPQEVSFVNETKVRRKATPFGFGLTWSGLSPRQLAIAAALGLSRS